VYSSYVNVAKPQGIQRVGLRYVNEIQFQTDSVALSEYFTYHPNFGSDLPQINLNVNMSTDFPFSNYRDAARLQLGTVPGAEESSIAVSLDIDYFLLIPNAVPLTDTESWLNQAHEHINNIFEGSITDKTRKMLQIKGER
jgi:uncharacterized protein (TIGR04255 family)